VDAALVGTLFFLPALAANAAALLAKPLQELRFGGSLDRILTRGRIALFGDNKTAAGCVLMVLGALVVGENIWALHETHSLLPKTFAPLWQESVVLWLLLGVGACFGDLSGSFLKRRIGIAAGKDFWFFDQIDWFVGAVLAVWLFGHLPSWDLVAWGALVLISVRFVLEIPRRVFLTPNRPRA